MKKIFITCILLMTGVSFSVTAQTTLINALNLLQQKNFIPALEVCNTLLAESPTDPSVLGVRSQIYTAMGRHDQAMQDADKAYSIDNTSYRARYAKADALYYGQKNYAQALQQYEAAIKSDAQMTEAYAGKARALMGLQNHKEAMKVIEDALRIFQNDAELYYVRGLLNFQRGKPLLAVEDYDKALSINANWNTCQVFLNRGIANDALQKSELAIQDFTRAIVADPNHVGGYTARGNILYNVTRYQEAVEDFKKAEILSPDNAVIPYNIGMAYYKINERNTACKYFQKSCSQGNNNACKMVVLNCSDRKNN